jgi:iron complex outermembrane receptor protein
MFNRNSNNLIDYVKEEEDDLWQATNIQDVRSNGFEANTSYGFNMLAYKQNINLGYTFLDEDLKNSDLNFSRYSINSLKHHVTATYRSQFIKHLSQSIAYKYAQRTTGENYSVVDAKVTLAVRSFEVSVIGNNIFNAEYTETNMVPMPKGNVLVDVKYRF